MEAILWILFWIVGGVIVYTMATLMYACDGGWADGGRHWAIVAAFCSWAIIGTVIFILIIAGIIFGCSWLCKKALLPYLVKYEVWVCKKLSSKKEKVTV